MADVKKRGRRSISSPLLVGDPILDEIKMRGILMVNGKIPKIAAFELGVSESAVAKFLKSKARSRRFFKYLENLSNNNDIIVERPL